MCLLRGGWRAWGYSRGVGEEATRVAVQVLEVPLVSQRGDGRRQRW